MKLTVLLILVVLTRLSGGSSCALLATVRTRQRGEQLQLQLECGRANCTSRFWCDNIYEALSIGRLCRGENCTKSYSLCEAPQNVCVPQVKPSKTMSSIENQLCSCTNLAHGHDTQSLQAECNTKTHVLSSGLGAVLGLVVVALAVVTFGWVWTCWTMRKKEGIKVKSEENRRHNEIQQCYTNPAYGETAQPQTATLTATYDVPNLPSPETIAIENGQTYNALDRGQPKGHNDSQEMGNVHDDVNYSHLHNCLEQDEEEDKEKGGEHMYHVLEKPGGDDYEDPD